jgi:polyferredoxin
VKIRTPPVAAALLTAALLTVVKLAAPYQMLLADRFFPGAGWAEIVILAVYAALILRAFTVSADTSAIRRKIWLAFSILFFSQFILGVSGIDSFLMTGRLHVPVPAVVIAGPLFRGERFFMPILFLSTILLVGPAWCSHLCYFGGWDGIAAARKTTPGRPSKGWPIVRFSIFVLTPVLAILLRVAGVDGSIAAYAAIGFGAAGLGVSAFVSTRLGVMVHCTSICPLGVIGNFLGKVSPFRITIGETCADCGRCVSSCRYNALSTAQITKRKPGYTCTLCGDCLPSCPHDALSYGFLGIKPETARIVFLVLIVSLHAVFMGVARI